METVLSLYGISSASYGKPLGFEYAEDILLSEDPGKFPVRLNDGVCV